MSNDQQLWFMPDEGDPHQRTWMAFGASEKIWGKKLLPEVQRNLATIALTIAKYEPVSLLVRHADLPLAQRLMGSNVELILCPLDDLWIRDTGPVFVVTAHGEKAAVDFNFNGWGEKQDCDFDAEVATFIAQRASVRRIQTDLVLEGGGIEVDGHGTAIITESCVLNENRNPGVSKVQCERELKRILGLEKIIWLPGIKGKDITDGHTDFYARFAHPGVVVAGYDPDPKSFDHAVTQRHLNILRKATDVKGRELEVIVLEAPSTVRGQFANADFAAGYINFYVCNGAVIAPEFGDARTDAAAKRELQRAFPGREVVQINVDGIAAGGGGIHCTTQQEPKV
jgi:agmatine deiminase